MDRGISGVSSSRIRCLQTLSVLLSAPKLAISDVLTGCLFGVQTQKNPRGGAVPETAPGRAVGVGQGQAQGRLRAPLGPAGAISHEEQQSPSPSLMSYLFMGEENEDKAHL